MLWPKAQEVTYPQGGGVTVIPPEALSARTRVIRLMRRASRVHVRELYRRAFGCDAPAWLVPPLRVF